MARSRVYALSLLVAMAAIAGCAQDATGPSDTSGGEMALWPVAQPRFLSCEPRPYAVGSALIGPAGGSIKVGKNEFKVPKGALLFPTLIKMEMPSDSVNSVRFSPEGLFFNPMALPDLKLDYKNCELPKDAKPKVVYTTESLRVIETLPTTTDSTAGTVDAKLRHFSRYAITY